MKPKRFPCVQSYRGQHKNGGKNCRSVLERGLKCPVASFVASQLIKRKVHFDFDTGWTAGFLRNKLFLTGISHKNIFWICIFSKIISLKFNFIWFNISCFVDGWSGPALESLVLPTYHLTTSWLLSPPTLKSRPKYQLVPNVSQGVTEKTDLERNSDLFQAS